MSDVQYGARRYRPGTQPPIKVEIDDPVTVAAKATAGVFVALLLIVALTYLLLGQPDANAKKIRALCAHHQGVLRVDGGTDFMDGSAFVTCRDGWYERVDN